MKQNDKQTQHMTKTITQKYKWETYKPKEQN